VATARNPIAPWYKMTNDPETKIGCPRPVYTGPTQRPFVALEKC
jgi:citrate synthase